jgi:mevalonate kinase
VARVTVEQAREQLGVSAAAPHGAASLPAGARAPVAVSTPGKLILMGEHAVVYGRPALVAAIDLRLTARFSTPDEPGPQLPRGGASTTAAQPAGGAPEVEVELPAIDYHTAASWAELLGYARQAREGWAAYAASPGPESFRALRGEDPGHIVKVALGEAAAALGEPVEPAGAERQPPVRLRLRLDSQLPVGAGFGSSAAAAVAVVAGYAVWHAAQAAERRTARQRPRRAGNDNRFGALDVATVERLALEVERRQHGLPSGVDTATSLHGGMLWAERQTAGGLHCVALPTGSPLLGRLQVVHSGTPPEPTGAVVAAVRARRDRNPAAFEALFDRMAAATCALRDELAWPAEAADRVRALIHEHQLCLEALGVVPEPVRALVRQIEAAGGAAKVSGAGSLAGPGAGSLLIYHPRPERIAGWEFLRPFASVAVHLGAAGCRRETS